MTERPFYFDQHEGTLFGVLHQPATPQGPPFVFCHPFAEEKLWAHRVFVTFARELASRGHTVLRFDYRGNGDSSGDFSETSVETVLADVGAAIDTVKGLASAQEVSLLGLRFGATMASLVAERRSDVAQLVLWAPIVDGSRYMQELLRVNLATQMAVYKEIRNDRAALVETMKQGKTVNVDGYAVAWPMFDQLSAVRLAAAPLRYAGRSFIVQIERREDAPLQAELERLRERYPGAEVARVQEEPFWKEIERFYETAPNLFAATLPWLGHA